MKNMGYYRLSVCQLIEKYSLSTLYTAYSCFANKFYREYNLHLRSLQIVMYC